MTRMFETEHYIFHVAPGSLAAQDVQIIAAEQETSYRYIHHMLGLVMEEKINYYLFNSREEVGRAIERKFGIYSPNNGCAVSENEIYAVYNQEIKCIGPHEDTHVLAFALGRPASSFLEEGLACAMDAQWWGVDNHTWVRYYRKNGGCPSINELLHMDWQTFGKMDCSVTYPVAGSFVTWLLLRFGREKFFQIYTAEDYDAAENILGSKFDALEADYFEFIGLLRSDKAVESRIAELIEENSIG